MHDIELVLGLLVPVLLLAVIGRRINVPYPILLVLGGLGLSLLPGLPRVGLAPELVFLLFLPPLLYVGAFYTSIRDFRANLRPIGLLAVGLVVATTAVVAAVAHAAIPDLDWPAAFVLGAIVSPPDAVAATAILRRLGVPRRVLAILEGESLVNDAIALVVYRAALAALATGTFSLGELGLRFVVASLGGALIGLAVGSLVAQLRRPLHDPPVEITISVLTPFAAYLPAEALGVSGVLAVVTAGLYLGQRASGLMDAHTRIRGDAFWDTLIFLLNGLLFILVGLQLRGIMVDLSSRSPLSLLGIGLLISLTVILVRFAWVFPATYLPRLLSPSLRKRDPSPAWQYVFVLGWAGMRGALSLAAALALPAICRTVGPSLNESS